MHICVQKSDSVQLQTSSLKLAAQPAISCTYTSSLAPIYIFIFIYIYLYLVIKYFDSQHALLRSFDFYHSFDVGKEQSCYIGTP